MNRYRYLIIICLFSKCIAQDAVLVKDIRSGSNGSYADYLTRSNNTLFFIANDGIHNHELWKSDGTTSGTVMVKDIAIGGASDPTDLTDVNGVLFFTAMQSITLGRQLWKSDGTVAGTTLVKNIRFS